MGRALVLTLALVISWQPSAGFAQIERPEHGRTAQDQAAPLWDDVCRGYQGGYIDLTLCWYTDQLESWPYADARVNEALSLLSTTYGVKGRIRARAIVVGFLAESHLGYYEPVTGTALVAVPKDDGRLGLPLLVLIHEIGHILLTQQGVPGADQHCQMFNGPLWDLLEAQWKQWYGTAYVTPEARPGFCN